MTPAGGVLDEDAQGQLVALLELYWLRPETAAWRACDILAMAGVEFRAPIADVGCGDGLFSFTRAGGRLDPVHDAFRDVAQLEGFFQNVDIYDHAGTPRALPIARAPRYRIDVGIDHKQALLDKASRLSFYDELRRGDASLALPLEDGRFRTIFSNILYWLEDHRGALREMRRALAEDGIVVLTVPSDTFRDYSFHQRLHVRTGDPEWSWLSLIDRGRSESVRLCQSQARWQDDFESAGFQVVQHRRYLSKLLLEAWDIGLRPISPLLIEMATRLSPPDRAEIKRRWVASLLPLVAPLCRLETPQDREHPPGFHLFVLKGAGR